MPNPLQFFCVEGEVYKRNVLLWKNVLGHPNLKIIKWKPTMSWIWVHITAVVPIKWYRASHFIGEQHIHFIGESLRGLSLVFPAKGLLPWSLQDLLSGGPSFPESPLPLRSSKVFVCFCWSLERFKVNSNLLSLQRSWKQTCPAKVFKWSWDTNSWWQ